MDFAVGRGKDRCQLVDKAVPQEEEVNIAGALSAKIKKFKQLTDNICPSQLKSFSSFSLGELSTLGRGNVLWRNIYAYLAPTKLYC